MDKGALNGLRGFLACHIFVEHCVSPQIDIYGHIALQPFFLISGFCLTLGYGKTIWSGSRLYSLRLKTTASDKNTNLEIAGNGPQIFDAMPFYKRRLIRILPIHYLALIARMLAQILQGQGR